MQADNVARRLCLELRSVVEFLPEQERSSSAMARALEIDRNTCQRIVATTGRGEPDARTLVQLPGVRGLMQFIEAMQRRATTDGHRQVMNSCAAAVDDFSRLIEQLAGSQRKLRERLAADVLIGDAPVGPSDDLRSRRSLFHAAAAVTGRWSESWISMTMIRPLPTNPLMTETLKVRGHFGHVARAAAVPLEIGESATKHLMSDSTGPTYEPVSGSAAGNEDPSRNFLLEPFCSQPLPKLTSRAMGTKMIHVIEGDSSGKVCAADIVIGERRARADRHPATQHPALGEVWTMVTFPARRLVFDVYLHRDIASRCIPSLELHLWGPHVGEQGLWRWSTRFPGGPKLELMTPGSNHAATSAYARLPEMTQHVFEQANWNPREFVGFRCDVTYPVWRAGYCMLFDFTGNELPDRR